MGLVALKEHIFFGTPTGRSSEQTTMAVVAQIDDDADRWLRSVVGGRPLAGSVMQAAGSFGAITLREGSVNAKVQLLPFGGDAYGVFAYVGSILLLNEPQSIERLSPTQRRMNNPVVRSAAAELIAAQDEAIARYTAESASDMLEPEQRCAASKKAAHQRNIRGALSRRATHRGPVTGTPPPTPRKYGGDPVGPTPVSPRPRKPPRPRRPRTHAIPR